MRRVRLTFLRLSQARVGSGCFCLSLGVLLMILTVAGIGTVNSASGQTATTSKGALLPVQVLSSAQRSHSEESPVMVAQGELDKLINPGGGGACPISAALIAMQGLRKMNNMPFDAHPHRAALRWFQEKPELKEGRISNERFEQLLKSLSWFLDNAPVTVSTVSAPNSTHNESNGEVWSFKEGPNFATNAGEIKILAYTVTTANGEELGRHFVLLKQSVNQKLQVLNPSKPSKDYTFITEYRGKTFSSRERVFLHVPAGVSARGMTHELNTVFTVSLSLKPRREHQVVERDVPGMKAAIDKIAARLDSRNEVLSPLAWREEGARVGLPGLDLPMSVGGGGWSTSQMLEVFLHAGRHNLNLRDVVGAAHARPLTKVRSPIATRVLEKIISGEAYLAVAITEPEVGTDMKAMKSRAVPYGKGFKLTGRKLWNARLRQASHVVIYTLAASIFPSGQRIIKGTR